MIGNDNSNDCNNNDDYNDNNTHNNSNDNNNNDNDNNNSPRREGAANFLELIGQPEQVVEAESMAEDDIMCCAVL